MNKTTSFSKISAIKNDLIKTNKDILINNFENSDNLTPALIENKSNEIIPEISSSLLADSTNDTNFFQNNRNLKKKIATKKKSFNEYKNWCSENNLSVLKNKLIDGIQNSYTTELIQNKNDNDILDLESLLQFSDHALFEESINPSITNNHDINSIDNIDVNMQSKTDLNFNCLPENYDIYKLTKKNYKLTFNKNINCNSKTKNKNREDFNIVKSLPKDVDEKAKNDSLISSFKQKNDIKKIKSLINQYNHNGYEDIANSNNHNNTDYNDDDNDDDDDDDDYYDEDEDDAEEEDDDHIDYDKYVDYVEYVNRQKSNNYKNSNESIRNINLKSEIFKKISEHEFLNYLNEKNSLSNHNGLLNLEESMINWSMKLSNYQVSNKRSNSRSLSRSNSSSQIDLSKRSTDFKTFKDNYKQYNKDNPIDLENIFIYDQLKKNKKHEAQQKTSWGKLKNSKSSCSNISNSINNSNDENIDLNQSLVANNFINPNFHYSDNKIKNSILEFENNDNENRKKQDNICKFNMDSRLYNLPSTSTPSLFKLFQDSKANINIPSNHDQKINPTTDRFLSSKMNSKETNDFEKNSKLKTTSFSQLRERSQSSHAVIDYSIKNDKIYTNTNKDNFIENRSFNSNNQSSLKKSIGIQHQHRSINQKPTIVCMFVESNQKTTTKEIMAAAKAARVAVARRSTSLFSTKSSLPDLTFLKEYSDENNKKDNLHSLPNKQSEETYLSNMTQSSDASISKTNQSNSNAVIGSDLLKRKTLKSIKRYRQTKQNTEPCLLDREYQTSLYDQSFDTEEDRVFLKINNYNYIDHDNYVSVNQEIKNDKITSNNSKKEKRPLKSCLKRKESQPLDIKTKLNNNYYDSNFFEPNQESQNLNSELLIKNCTPLRLSEKNDIINEKKNISKQMTFMFVPSTGYLFTCDHESSTRYRYYNTLEQKRRLKNYYQLTNVNEKINKNIVNGYDIEENNLNRDYFDNSEFDCVETSILNNRNSSLYYNGKSFNESKSENDLRVKKSVTFLSSVKEHVDQKKNLLTSSSPKETSLLSKNNKKAPLLQYNNLIAMLNTNPLEKNEIVRSNDRNKIEESQHHISSDLSNKNIDRNAFLSYKDYQVNQLRQNNNNNNLLPVNQNNPLKNLQIIDTDSISIASLSESPPSEFKFSDEEDNVNQFPVKSTKQDAKFKNSEISENKDEIVSNKNLKDSEKKYEHEKYLRIQQIKLNQTKRKNFNASILNDSKLSNLKNIITIVKQQQDKLKLVSKSARNDNSKYENQPLSGSSSANTSTSLNGSITSNITQTSSTITSNLISNRSSNNNIDIVEFKDIIDRLSQAIFEFLKQGLKPISLDLILNSISQNQSPNISIKSPSESPISFCQQQIESNSLTTTFSQYTQIWNLIENTMNMNFLNENNLVFLPKDAYLAMFQEINRYANNINHTYLIDSRANTSQLRRKHHLMVLLIGLKYKFQLFLMYLLCYHQLANWFEFLDKNRNLLKSYYDLKANAETKSDESTENFQTSINSSFSTSLNLMDSKCKNNNLSSSSIKICSNISVFENEEYFNYFYRLLQQLDLIDFDLQLLRKISQIKYEITSMNNEGITNSHTGNNGVDLIDNKTENLSKKPFVPLRKISARRSSNNSRKIESSIISNSPSINNEKVTSLNRINQVNSCNNSSSGFNFKSISKKFNFKSWFTSSNSQLNQTSKHESAIDNFKHKSKSPHNLLTKPFPTTLTNQMQEKFSHKINNKNLGGVLNSNIFNKPFNENIMKHSLSEPSINALIQ